MSISAIKMIHKYMDRWSWRESFGQKSILKQEESSISRSNQIILFYRPRASLKWPPVEAKQAFSAPLLQNSVFNFRIQRGGGGLTLQPMFLEQKCDCQRTFGERSLFAKSNPKKGTYSSCGLHRFQRGLWSQRTLECFWIWKWLWKY